MSFLTYGSAKALSVQNDYEKDIDRLYQRESYRAQVQAEKEKKSQFYASLMKEQTAVAPYNSKRLTEFYDGLTKQVADFSLNNPNWESDVMQSQQMYSIMNQFIDNDIIREDQQVQADWEATKKSAQEGRIFQGEYDAFAEKYNNYRNNGGEPYQFINPKRKTTAEILQEANQRLASTTKDVTDPKTYKITRETSTPDENIHLEALSILTDPEGKRAFTREYNDIPESEKGMFASIHDYVEQRIRGGEEVAKINAGYDEAYLVRLREAASKSGNASDYNRYYLSNVYTPLAQGQKVAAHPANVAFTEFGKEGGSLAMDGRGRVLKVMSQDGNSIENMNVKGIVTEKSAGEIVLIGGLPFVRTHVTVTIDDNQQALDEYGNPAQGVVEREKGKRKNEKDELSRQTSKILMADELTKHGFVNVSSSIPGQLMSLNGSKVTGDVYDGWVIMPANFSKSNRMSYDDYFGKPAASMLKSDQAYDENLDLVESIKSNNVPVVSSKINQRQAQTIADNFGIDVSNNQWQKSETNDYIWLTKGSDGSVLAYDFSNDKVYKRK